MFIVQCLCSYATADIISVEKLRVCRAHQETFSPGLAHVCLPPSLYVFIVFAHDITYRTVRRLAALLEMQSNRIHNVIRSTKMWRNKTWNYALDFRVRRLLRFGSIRVILFMESCHGIFLHRRMASACVIIVIVSLGTVQHWMARRAVWKIRQTRRVCALPPKHTDDDVYASTPHIVHIEHTPRHERNARHNNVIIAYILLLLFISWIPMTLCVGGVSRTISSPLLFLVFFSFRSFVRSSIFAKCQCVTIV